jgi:hypothetical protein
MRRVKRRRQRQRKRDIVETSIYIIHVYITTRVEKKGVICDDVGKGQEVRMMHAILYKKS